MITSHTISTSTPQVGQTTSLLSSSTATKTSAQPPVQRLHGVVKFYDANKGFGYIVSNGWQYYFDALAIRAGRPKSGDAVTFVPFKPQNRSWNAFDVVVV